MTEVADRTRVAGKAYISVFEDPEWGLKASEEDAMLAVIDALYPDFPKGADGIYAIRANERLDALCTEMWEGPVSDGHLDEYDIAGWLIPRLDAVLGTGTSYVVSDIRSGAVLATVAADSPLGALDAYAVGEGFGPYSDLIVEDPDGGFVYQMPDGSIGAVFTNYEITAKEA